MDTRSLEELKEDYSPTVDLGKGHFLAFCCWKCDRDLNPQYADIPDVERYSGIHIHPRPDGNGYCVGSVTFRSESSLKLEPGRPMWNVECWEPLTLSPSLLCRSCGSHGFIRNGKWEDC